MAGHGNPAIDLRSVPRLATASVSRFEAHGPPLAGLPLKMRNISRNPREGAGPIEAMQMHAMEMRMGGKRATATCAKMLSLRGYTPSPESEDSDRGQDADL
ncbi:hypothetical protein VTJ49DRAFT_7414 [Mycothermus thermophilus]|uniref:Uncharacterized protein n=1 Tax=Humicola insolens TaxID=85995 RepID=A0ABR3VIC1_HUMIN